MSDAWQQHFRNGLGLLDGEKLAEAIVELSRALVEAPDAHVAQCYATRGYAQLCQGEYQLAIDDCNLAIEHDKSDGEAFAWRGSAHAGLSQWRETINDYLVAIRLCPEKADEYRDILLAHLDDAIRDFTSRINGGARGEAYRDRGSAYAFRGEHQAAVQDFTKAIEHERRDGVAYARRGESLFALKQYEQAADDCTRGTRCGVDDAAIYFTRAKAFRQLGQADKAVADLTRAIRHEPRFAAAFCERGLAQISRRAIDAAIGDFTRAVALDPKLDEPLVQRAKLQAERGQFASAINDYTAALKVRPNHTPYLLARGQTYLDMQLPQEALRDFDAVLAIDAVNRVAYRGRGLAQHQQGDADGAVREFTKAIRLDARYAAAYECRGDVYLEREDYDKASADFSKAIELTGANCSASLYNRRGVARLDSGNYAGAVQDFTSAIQRDAHDADSHAWRAAAYGQLNRCGAALDDVARAIELAPQRAAEYRQIGQHASEQAIPALSQEIKSHPQDARLYRERAMAYEFKEAANEALADYNTAIQLAPDERDNYFRRGSILWRAGRFERALADFSKAIALGDERAVCFHHRGVSLARLGKAKQALEDLQRAVELNPEDGKFYRDRAEVYAATGQLDSAEADFSQAINKNAGDSRAFFGRGYVHHLRRNYEQAIRDFSTAIAHDKQHAMSYFRRGESLASLGKFAPAINDFDAAIQLDPNMIAAFCSRGLTIAKAGRHARAVLELTKAGGRIRYDVRFAQAFDCRARIYYSMGQYARALTDFERVLELQPPEQNLAQTHYGRGLALAQLDKREQAAASFEQALKTDANHRDARAALEWLRGDRSNSLAALKRPAKIAPLPQPPVIIPPVRLENGVDAFQVEPLWDQWLVQADDGREYGPVTKTELDTWVIQGRLGAKSTLLRMDWDDWQSATDIYRELALATHRTANRPMPVQPPPSVAQTLELAASESVEEFPVEGAEAGESEFKIKL